VGLLGGWSRISLGEKRGSLESGSPSTFTGRRASFRKQSTSGIDATTLRLLGQQASTNSCTGGAGGRRGSFSRGPSGANISATCTSMERPLPLLLPGSPRERGSRGASRDIAVPPSTLTSACHSSGAESARTPKPMRWAESLGAPSTEPDAPAKHGAVGGLVPLPHLGSSAVEHLEGSSSAPVHPDEAADGAPMARPPAEGGGSKARARRYKPGKVSKAPTKRGSANPSYDTHAFEKIVPGAM